MIANISGSKAMKLSAIAAVTLAVLWASAATAKGNVEAGAALAQQWCSSCHQVKATAAASDTAPPFASLANDGSRNLDWAKAWLSDPHPPMTGINLSRQQIDDVVAYLKSLRTKD
jgi:mono/diheme cytochrome c family protein